MSELDKKVDEWMQSLGFQSNIEAEIPNYIFGMNEWLNPSELTKKVAEDSRAWDPVEDVTVISPEIAKLFYLSKERW